MTVLYHFINVIQNACIDKDKVNILVATATKPFKTLCITL
jgi:hypothetical protein